tara:strand:- start:190 stop:531 length:342 start_codon:yes stop_codon:yes gene_type:complete
MELKRKYTVADISIKNKDYEVGEDFISSLYQIEIPTGIKIAKFIETNISALSISTLVSYVYGGLVMDKYNRPITFIIEVVQPDEYDPILSDLQLIPMDEYLDLMNLNLVLSAK